MKRKIFFLLMLLLSFAIIGCQVSFRADASTNDLNSLLDERQTDCWVEGELFGDLVLGSRGTIQFIYLDAKLSKAISAEQGLAPWVDDLNQYYGSPETRKKALFIANLEANKPWTVEEQKISIGGYHLTKKTSYPQAGRILSGLWMQVPAGSLPLLYLRTKSSRGQRSWWGTVTT